MLILVHVDIASIQISGQALVLVLSRFMKTDESLINANIISKAQLIRKFDYFDLKTQ